MYEAEHPEEEETCLEKHTDWTLVQWNSVLLLTSDETKVEIFGSTRCVFVGHRKDGFYMCGSLKVEEVEEKV